MAKLVEEHSISGGAHWVRLRSAWSQKVLEPAHLPHANTYRYISAHLDVAALRAAGALTLSLVA